MLQVLLVLRTHPYSKMIIFRHSSKGFTPPLPRSCEQGRDLHARAGFTLMELMIGAAILVTAIVSLLATYITTAALIESSRNTTTALNDASRAIEQIRNNALVSFSSVTLTNWTTWAAGNGADTLTDEQLSVCYYNLSGTLLFCSTGTTSANPIEVRVTVNWTERNRARSEQVVTLVTNRQ